MQLHYNILWIDNDLPEYIERGQIEKVKSNLSDLGFEPYIVPLLDDSELDFHLNKTRFDLIISDYQLDHTTGDKIIEHIRDKKIMTEILFYSAKINFREDDTVKETLKLIDRISFHFGRDTLLDRIENLIELTLDKLLDINATRGIITSATSELDVTMECVAHSLLDKIDVAENQDKLKKIFTSDYNDNRKYALKRCKGQRGLYLEDFKTYYSNSEAYRKWHLLKQFLKTFCPAGFDTELFKNYNSDVITIRNRFAHAKSEEIDGKLYLKGQYGKEDFKFDKDSCIDIRKNLILHKRNFDILIDHFQ